MESSRTNIMANRISQYFGDPYTDTPATWPNTPDGKEIVRFLQHTKYADCFLGVTNQNEVVYEYFYCLKCRAWKKISTSVGHITMHFNTSSHNEKVFEAQNNLSREWQIRLIKMIELFILSNGLPFSLIEDPYLKIIPELGNRKHVRNKSINLAKKVRSLIKEILARVEYCTISLDEWTDICQKRYLGITCHTTLECRLKIFSLAHVSIDPIIASDDRDHLVADDLAFITNSILKAYNISSKVLLIVTDRAKVMEKCVVKLNDLRMHLHEDLVLWGNCCCHVLNSFLTEYLKLFQQEFKEIVNIQKKLIKSEIFESFLIRRNAKVTRIPSYCEVRWYSLFRMLKYMIILKNDIIDFFQQESLGIISNQVWETINNLYSVVDVVKRNTKALEGENYSTICYVLHSFQAIYNEFKRLSEKSVDYVEYFQTWSKYYNNIVSETKKNWYPLLEVATFLHPGLNHAQLISKQERIDVLNFLKRDYNKWCTITELSALSQSFNSYSRPSVGTKTNFSFQVQNTNYLGRKEVLEASKKKNNNALLDLMTMIGDNTPATETAMNIRDEINIYESLCARGRLEPVSFWKENALKLPRLASIAHKIMSIIPSSASTERQFSTSKRIQGLSRAHMNDNVFEDQIILTANLDITNQVYDILEDEISTQ